MTVRKKKSIDFGNVPSDGVTLTKEIHLTGTIKSNVKKVAVFIKGKQEGLAINLLLSNPQL